ncbi:MAG: DUF2726 domain-containing protein [Chloroflexota bacterium]
MALLPRHLLGGRSEPRREDDPRSVWVNGLIKALIRFLRSLFGGADKVSSDETSQARSSRPLEFPYRKRESLVSSAERQFYHQLRDVASAQGWAVFGKVRLEDLIEVRPGSANFNSHRGRIKARHIDFVLCKPESLAPLLAIELNDLSHNRPERQERDEFVERALLAAGLPILWIKGATGHDSDQLMRLIYEKLDVGLKETSGSSEPRPEPANEVASRPVVGAGCPRCGAALVERQSRRDGTAFLGCSRYPQCRHTEPIKQDAMQSRGQAT